MSPQTYKSTKTTSCLFFMTSSNLLPRWCLSTCSLFTKSYIYQPPCSYLFATVLRAIRETLSRVINLNLAWINIFISFLDWPLIFSATKWLDMNLNSTFLLTIELHLKYPINIKFLLPKPFLKNILHIWKANRKGKSRSNDRLYFLGLQNHCRFWMTADDCSHEIKRHLLLGLPSWLSGRRICLPVQGMQGT